ncbi:MAG: DMT family transporter [Bacteroidota bacterium]
MSRSWVDFFKLHFIVFIWGFTAILGILISLHPIETVFYRTALAAFFLYLIILFKKKNFTVPFRRLIKIVVTGVIIAFHWILFFASAQISTASVCLAGMATVALWTSLVEPLYFKKSFKSYEIFLGLIVIVGLYVIFKFEFNHWLGLTLAIISAFLGALFSVINSQLTNEFDAYSITFYEMLAASITCLLFIPVYQTYIDPTVSFQYFPTSVNDILYLVALSLFCTVYAFSESVELMRRISAYAINLTVNLEPVYGIILAVLILNEDESMTAGFYWGTAIILLSVLGYPILNKRYKRKALEADIIR